MEIIIAKTAGFCFGIKNAVTKTEQILENQSSIYCLGELTHNTQVTTKFIKKGLKIINKIEEVPNNTKVIFRAHGEPEKTYNYAKKNNIEVIDLTCPKVINVHTIVKEYSDKEYFIVVFGERLHPEVIGHIGYAKKYFVISEKEEIEKAVNEIQQNDEKNILIVAQTTHSLNRFKDFSNVLKELLESQQKNVVIKNTVCNATEIRQKEAEELSKQVEYMIIIGGKKSSNTTQLYNIAKESNPNSILIETVKELDVNMVKQYKKVGIIAGSSTPNYSIEEVVEALERN